MAALALMAGVLVVGADPASAAPAITVVPDTGLTDFSPVQVSGTGFDGYSSLEIYQCRGGAVDEFDCDASNAYQFGVRPDGTFDYEFYVDARIYLPDEEEVDCRTDPAGCAIGVGFIVDADEWPQEPIVFDPDAPLKPPVTATATPTEGLTDAQVVKVSGENLTFREETFAYVCVAEPGEVGRRCDLDRLVRGVAATDGTIELDLPVWSSFNAPLGGPKTCGPLGDECEVLLSWSFYGAPDRRATVPIRFASAEPGPDPTVVTTVPGPTSPTPARGAAPVSGQAGYTG